MSEEHWTVVVAARKARAAAARKKRTHLANDLYNKWLIAGRPPVSAFARLHGLTRSSLERLLRYAERNMPWGKRRIGYLRNREYLTADEIWKKKSSLDD